MKNDKDVIEVAIKKDSELFEIVSENLRFDKVFILDLIKINYYIMMHLHINFLNDEEFILAAA
jgi:hypothetical protein